MEDYGRSKSYAGRSTMQVENYYGHPRVPQTSYELRSYSSSYAQAQNQRANYDWDLKKGKSTSGSGWGITDPELLRKKRVASYKMYSVEGKMKGSFRKSFRWLKDKYTQMVYGW